MEQFNFFIHIWWVSLVSEFNLRIRSIDVIFAGQDSGLNQEVINIAFWI